LNNTKTNNNNPSIFDKQKTGITSRQLHEKIAIIVVQCLNSFFLVSSSNKYGYNVDSSHIVGMPYAWTGRTDMSLDGYANPSGSYTFIGWENNSPFMIDTPPSGYTSTNLSYIFFVYYFYRYALGYDNYGTHGTINESLDYAARMTFGKISGYTDYTFGSSVLNVGQWMNNQDFPSFANLWFYCKLRVFGKGNIILPY
jgi:hypothetical protein